MQSLHHGGTAELWQALIRDGAARQRLTLDESEECYLGFVLIRHQRDALLGARVMALDWIDAHEERGRQRADALRDVGDRCLLIAGLYPQLALRRRLSGDYYVDLGRGAYAGVAECARGGEAGLFAQLAEAFVRLVRVLRAMCGGAAMTRADCITFASRGVLRTGR